MLFLDGFFFGAETGAGGAFEDVVVGRFEDGDGIIAGDERVASSEIVWLNGDFETEGADGKFIVGVESAIGNDIAVDTGAIGAVEVANTEDRFAVDFDFSKAAVFAGDFGRANLNIAFGMPANEDNGPIDDDGRHRIGGIQWHQTDQHGRLKDASGDIPRLWFSAGIHFLHGVGVLGELEKAKAHDASTDAAKSYQIATLSRFEFFLRSNCFLNAFASACPHGGMEPVGQQAEQEGHPECTTNTQQHRLPPCSV